MQNDITIVLKSDDGHLIGVKSFLINGVEVMVDDYEITKKPGSLLPAVKLTITPSSFNTKTIE